ncbi:MYND finger [Plectosphaerella cucumerina]|uniref:MYND finger n=1 Tax=Plectosphaerella cucumerina TaxID=40658 RepID=A0A8K0X2X9_9PEZI|nr:MYND finger [Plectosphaerella cucumerina]
MHVPRLTYLMHFLIASQARNLLILSLLVDGAVDHELLWNISYHVHLSDADARGVSSQAQKLLDASVSLSAWKSSTYGAALPFCDEATLHDVREVWSKYAAAEANIAENRAKLQLSIDFRKERAPKGSLVLTSLRSAAPAAIRSVDEVSSIHTHFWATGVTGSSKPTTPNPLIACPLSGNKLLHYGTDPILDFHLATAFTKLGKRSPLRYRTDGEQFKTVAAAKVQFRAWAETTLSLLSKEMLVVRSAIADVFAFCHTLQHWAASGEASAGWYRRQFDSRALTLDVTAQTPKLFNAIDTSNLADHVGALNIMLSALPLLSPEPYATLAIETLLKGSGEADKDMMKRLLQGHGSSVSILLGVSAVEAWTNSSSVSKVSEIMVNKAFARGASASQLHTRVSWKHATQLGGSGPASALKISPEDLARLLFQVYLDMFKHENQLNVITAALSGMGSTAASGYVHFQRGSFAALLRFVKERFPATDFEATCAALDSLVTADETLQLGSISVQDLGAQMHLQALPSPSWLHLDEARLPSRGSFNAWKNLPEVTAVTVVIPHSFIASLYGTSALQNIGAPTFIGSLRLGPGASTDGHNVFGGVQLTFGTLSKRGSPESDDFSADIVADPAGWAGNAPLIASFYVPTKALQADSKFVNVGLGLLPTPQNALIFTQALGEELQVYQTNLNDRERVCITKYMPGHSRYPVFCAAAKRLEKLSGATPSFTVGISDAGWVANITGHCDVQTESGKRLLKDMVPIQLRQTSPFTILLVFGKNNLVLPLNFPYPVDSTQAKTRIARKSAWIEVIAPIADPLTTPALDDYIYPSVLGLGNAKELVPLTLNSPHVSLDTLPILDLTDTSAHAWLSPLIVSQFSVRERRIRDRNLASGGLASSARLNFKESLFTMFMVAAGVQGEQTGLFAIDHPERGGIHMLLFVSSVRLDPTAASIVIDAAVLPFTMDIVTNPVISEFLLLLRSLKMVSMKVDDAELVLWKKVLPAVAERARTWSHKKTCEYRVKKTVPLSTEPGEPVFCSCGRGKLPKDFIALPEWDTAANFVTRIAISTTYSLPFIEDIIDMQGLPHGDDVDTGDDDDDDSSVSSASSASSSTRPPPKERCANCGTTAAEGTQDGALKKCMRCRKAAYCGAECQKEDWKQHRRDCKASQ